MRIATVLVALSLNDAVERDDGYEVDDVIFHWCTDLVAEAALDRRGLEAASFGNYWAGDGFVGEQLADDGSCARTASRKVEMAASANAKVWFQRRSGMLEMSDLKVHQLLSPSMQDESC